MIPLNFLREKHGILESWNPMEAEEINWIPFDSVGFH
jgi:hypothetical protein